MRIAFDAVGIRGHGGAALLLELHEWLPRARPEWNWDFFLLAADQRMFPDPATTSARVAVHSIDRASNPLERLIWSNVRMPALIQRLRSDVVVSFANMGSLRPPVPQVVFVHQPLLVDWPKGAVRSAPYRLRLPLHRALTDASLRRSAAIVVQTESMRRGLARRRGDVSGRVHVVPSGYRTPCASPIRPELWKALGASGRPRLLYVAHPSEHKNHERLVTAFGILAQRFPSATLLLTIDRAETADRRYASFVARIARTAERLGVSDRLVWLGRLQPAEIAFALAASDLLVYPSLAESFGLPLAEAMQARCPIAASDRPFAHDVAGHAAVYFDPLDPVNIAATVALAIESADLRGELIAAGRARSGQYSYSRIADRICGILESRSDN